MSSMYILIGINIIIMVVIILAASYVLKHRHMNYNEAENEIQKINDTELFAFLGKEFGPYLKLLKDHKVVAASYYFHITGMKERMKNAGKDALKSLASLGTMRFTTVEMPTPLLLADDGLHIFELDAEGGVNKHFLLEPSRLENATLSHFVYDKSPKVLGDCARYYMINVPCNGFEYELILCAVAYPTSQTFMFYSKRRKMMCYAAGKRFLKELGDLYPNLRT